MIARTTKAFAAAALSAGALVIAPSSASAAVTIGADISAAVSGDNGCSNVPSERCTYIQVNPVALFTSPIDGVIVRWRVRGDSKNVQYALRTARPIGALFEGGATSEAHSIGPGLPSTFETRLPIRQGEVIGIDVPGGSPVPTVAYTGPGSIQQQLWDPPLAAGEIRSSNGGGFGVMLLNADIEPDCDGDGFGDETQDPSLFGGGCAARARSLTLDASKSKVKKGKKVVLAGEVTDPGNEAGCEASQTVSIERSKPGKNEFKAVASAQTTATGGFSAELKVKKTFEYHAVLGANPSCLAATSNDVDVKAKPKK